MALVNVLVNGHAYTLACDEGEEEHLRELAQFLDKRVRELTTSVGQVGDARLLLMAGLVVSDELSESLAKLEERDKEIARLKEQLAEQDGGADENVIVQMLEETAVRIESITARLSAH